MRQLPAECGVSRPLANETVQSQLTEAGAAMEGPSWLWKPVLLNEIRGKSQLLPLLLPSLPLLLLLLFFFSSTFFFSLIHPARKWSSGLC